MAMKLTIEAGQHDRRSVPVCVEVRGGLPGRGGSLSDETTGEQVPCQFEDDQLWFILDKLDAGQTRSFLFDPVGAGAGKRGVGLKELGDEGVIEVRIGSRKFTAYHFNARGARPYLHPLIAPGGVRITRAFPMETVEGETTDHPHHRSFWVAHGDVNGQDHWSEQPGHGFQVHRKVVAISTGDNPVTGALTTRNEWLDRDRNPQLTETRTLRFYAADAVRIIDLMAQFSATHGPVKLGDTKEGGICALRVATTMDGKRGGRIQNSVGGVGEAECWGRPAHWVDYSGQAEGKPVGVAVFDHPMNLRHPTPWHVRDYGLFAANPFALHDYKQSLATDGSHTIDAGQTLTFRYRILLHKGDAEKAGVGEHYHGYVNPPKAQWAGA